MFAYRSIDLPVSSRVYVVYLYVCMLNSLSHAHTRACTHTLKHSHKHKHTHTNNLHYCYHLHWCLVPQNAEIQSRTTFVFSFLQSFLIVRTRLALNCPFLLLCFEILWRGGHIQHQLLLLLCVCVCACVHGYVVRVRMRAHAHFWKFVCGIKGSNEGVSNLFIFMHRHTNTPIWLFDFVHTHLLCFQNVDMRANEITQ